MAFFAANPWYSPYNGTRPSTDGFHNEQTVPEEYFFASTLPHNGSTVLQEEFAFSNPARSTGMLPGSTTGLVSGPIGLDQNINRSFDMVESPYLMWPSDNQSVLMDQIPCGLDAHSLSPSFFAPGSFPWTCDQHGYLLSGRDMWREAPVSSQSISASTLNAQIPFNESVLFGASAQVDVVSEIDKQQSIDDNFDISSLRRVCNEPGLPLIIDQQPSSQCTTLSLMSAPQHKPHNMFQNSGNSDLESNGAIVDLVRQAHQNNEPSPSTPPDSCQSFANKRTSCQISSVESVSPQKRAKMATGFRPIVSKSIVSSADIIEHIDSGGAKLEEPKKGRRTKPLTPEARKHARRARSEGVCAPCHRSHIHCDLERPICENCRNKEGHGRLRFGCTVGPLKEYTGAFIPVLLTADLNNWAIEKLIKEKHIVFTAHTMKISVSLDPFGIMMSLPVHEIFSTDQDYLEIPVLSADASENQQVFETRPSLQYGIYDRPMEYLEHIYTEYINEVSNHSIGAADDITGDTPKIIWKVVGAIQRFAQSNPHMKKNNLVPKALNVFWMHHLMGRSLVLSEDSAREAIESLQNSTAVLPPQPFVSAGLVNRQMKVVMKHALEAAIQDLLMEVDKELKRGSKSWAVCFCAILILCILVEQVHAATDAIVTDKTSREDQGAANILNDGIKACQDIEVPINYAWECFRNIQGKRNPVKNGRPISPHEQEEELIREIRNILTDHRDDISERAEATCKGGFSDTPTDHNRFYVRISAQYVSKFFRFFCLDGPPFGSHMTT